MRSESNERSTTRSQRRLGRRSCLAQIGVRSLVGSLLFAAGSVGPALAIGGKGFSYDPPDRSLISPLEKKGNEETGEVPLPPPVASPETPAPPVYIHQRETEIAPPIGAAVQSSESVPLIDWTSAPKDSAVVEAAPPGDIASFLVTNFGQSDVPPPPIPTPWWHEGVGEPLLEPTAAMPVTLSQLVADALANSPRIAAVNLIPEIKQTSVMQASAVFDPATFVDSIFRDTNDPVGNLLTTGGAPRFKERQIDGNLGVRSQNRYGGRTEFSQENRFADNNSQFFLPRQQANTKMVLRYTQPLMRGRGRDYNLAKVVIAQVDVEVAGSEALASIQEHIQELHNVYWQLYFHRSSLLQRRRTLKRLTTAAELISQRAAMDTTVTQAARAAAILARERAKLQGAAAEIAADQARLRSLVGHASGIATAAELLPYDLPTTELPIEHAASDLAAALHQRPEIHQLQQQLRLSRVQQQVAEHELRPTLNLVTESYVQGINPDYSVLDSFGDQFSRGRPTYSAGVAYLRPVNNSAARSILKQRNLEIRQLLFALDQRLADVSTEVVAAHARLRSAYADHYSAVEMTMATNRELDQLISRWQSAPILDTTSLSLLLDQILDAEVRLIESEEQWANTEASIMSAYAQLETARGSILAPTEWSTP